MRFPGIPGTIHTKEHPHWIELQSAQFGTGRAIHHPTGRGQSSQREAVTPNISEVVVTKNFDIASTRLFQESVQGTGKSVTIAFLQTEQRGLHEYLRLELENALISSYSVSGGGDTPMESMSLNFTKSKFVIKDHGPDASSGP